MEINMNTLRRGLTFGEAQLYIGNVSRSMMYRLMGEGLPSYTIGNRRYFLVSELDTFLERQSEKESR
tara:strand:+ start:286 stop:486 length:201 start_codon:yes stop_codon:yes gene_type:complete